MAGKHQNQEKPEQRRSQTGSAQGNRPLQKGMDKDEFKRRESKDSNERPLQLRFTTHSLKEKIEETGNLNLRFLRT